MREVRPALFSRWLRVLRHKLSNRAWRAVHLLSYFLFATTTVHMLTAGTDAKALIASSAAVLLGVAVTFASVALYLWRKEPGEPRAPARADRVPNPTPGAA